MYTQKTAWVQYKITLYRLLYSSYAYSITTNWTEVMQGEEQ